MMAGSANLALEEIGVVISRQTWLFLLSVGLGAALSCLYDVLRLLRMGVKHHDAVIFLQDVCYWFLFGMSIQLLFQYADDGYFRWYLLLGTVTGFVICHFTIGSLVVLTGRRIILFTKHLFEKLYAVMIRPVGKKIKQNATSVVDYAKQELKLAAKTKKSGKK